MPRLVPLLDVPLCAAVVAVALLGALGLAGVTYALIALGEDGRSVVVATGAGGVLLLAAFVLVERRLRVPLLPPGSFAPGSPPPSTSSPSRSTRRCPASSCWWSSTCRSSPATRHSPQVR